APLASARSTPAHCRPPKFPFAFDLWLSPGLAPSTPSRGKPDPAIGMRGLRPR
ncbi:unnamed protein product, partial [Gulo gulo]